MVARSLTCPWRGGTCGMPTELILPFNGRCAQATLFWIGAMVPVVGELGDAE